ncbi:MAG: alcohol dehydrogenase catalytic domain-containing protein [Solirubrobacterales bacterium]|nr:alcohol dehydrogenase catalytic domain-containing protein [Solirubrobacterales bacterium]
MLWDYGRDWEIDELTPDDPREGEVLVRLAASGLCHSDKHVRIGDLPMEALPAIGGHEGAGVIEAVGPGGRLPSVFRAGLSLPARRVSHSP